MNITFESDVQELKLMNITFKSDVQELKLFTRNN